jgi:hypothetical protein
VLPPVPPPLNRVVDCLGSFVDLRVDGDFNIFIDGTDDILGGILVLLGILVLGVGNPDRRLLGPEPPCVTGERKSSAAASAICSCDSRTNNP